MSSIERLNVDALRHEFEEWREMLADPEVMDQRERYLDILKRYGERQLVIDQADEQDRKIQEIEELEDLLAEEEDEEALAYYRSELETLKEQLLQVQANLRLALQPKDPRDERALFLEIRAGAGGEEAALFARTLYRMYTRYAEDHHFSCETLELSESEQGGVKEVVFQVKGSGAFSRFKYEMGVHRVQRVPETESSGRIHTSTCTVAVIPEADEVDVVIDPKDLRIDTYRASGAGGQHVNMTDSAIRITHIPTGLVVTCQDERSQIKNRDKAMRVLRARLWEKAQQEQEEERADARRQQIGRGDRSERIRTYNFPQGRVSDHRIGLTLYKLEGTLNGDLDELIDALRDAELAEGASSDDTSNA